MKVGWFVFWSQRCPLEGRLQGNLVSAHVPPSLFEWHHYFSCRTIFWTNFRRKLIIFQSICRSGWDVQYFSLLTCTLWAVHACFTTSVGNSKSYSSFSEHTVWRKDVDLHKINRQNWGATTDVFTTWHEPDIYMPTKSPISKYYTPGEKNCFVWRVLVATILLLLLKQSKYYSSCCPLYIIISNISVKNKQKTLSLPASTPGCCQWGKSLMTPPASE